MLFNNALNVRSSINSVNYSSRVAHPYHLVDGSPWPLLMALALLGFAVTVVSWLTGFPQSLLSLTPILLIALIATLWWRDVIRESKGGFHTAVVVRGLTVGFLLFLVSEIM
jgi:cytochrome c oxidase subunit 3